MIQVGDIIIIEEYKDINGETVTQHPLIVLNTSGGKIEGFDFNLIGCFMSSFKNVSHKRSVLSHDSNLPVTVNDGVEKEGFIKADVIHYFEINNLRYYLVGSISKDIYDKLIQLLNLLDDQNRLKINLENIN